MTGEPPRGDPWPEELGGHDDGTDHGPVVGHRRRRVIRIAVMLALGAMLLPVVLSAVGVARGAAARACTVYVADLTVLDDSRVEFDAFARGGPGWLCIAVSPSGTSTVIGNLGLMPAAPKPAVPGRET
ncbi:hypothetical protein [Agromyces marinus]|uniref:Uncharacterized protein n=1 Tax=Agromyces marinus TaxID=1389020 RepID=A0ABN6YIU8_9MICO|nr:hypothetical protein [Agromyces marinus]UIP59169.1 hypothetical protein DSM26151_20660 [Agromyces marinus]BDZ55832.1 hypothetical protein GCM10025870_29050 [Agromyces marinus]